MELESYKKPCHRTAASLRARIERSCLSSSDDAIIHLNERTDEQEVRWSPAEPVPDSIKETGAGEGEGEGLDRLACPTEEEELP